jgi:hypothetical protein
VLIMREGNLAIGVGTEALLLGREPVSGNLAKNLQYALIEHIPGAYLLLDHLFADIGRQHRHYTPIGLNAFVGNA